jgi:RNA polymerase sigma-70 factor, ECF subfamily
MSSALSVPISGVPAPADLETVYDTGARLVWLTLQRLGVRHADLEDLSHDVFLIAHRRFRELSGTVAVNAWLFGICLRVAANYRRRARFRRELPAGTMTGDEGPIVAAPTSTRPDHQAAQREAQQRAQTILDGMDLAKRAVFVMFELEGLSCLQIATELGVPIGTVYSRLHAARAFFEKAARNMSEGHHG